MNEFERKLIGLVVECPREGQSDDSIRFTLERALGYRKLMLKMGTPKELYNLLLDYCAPSEFTGYKQMDYKDFLGTIYWNVVREYKIFKAGYKCEECSSTEKLDVHHKTYQFRGRELYHLECLEVLCRNCHAARHDIQQTPSEA